jgi:hypothetical protein
VPQQLVLLCHPRSTKVRIFLAQEVGASNLLHNVILNVQKNQKENKKKLSYPASAVIVTEPA